MDEEWGPWIEHDGKGCPCRGEVAHVVMRFRHQILSPCASRRGKMVGEREWIGLVNPSSDDGSWDWSLPYNPVIRYRIRKPRGLTILEEIAKGIREPVDA